MKFNSLPHKNSDTHSITAICCPHNNVSQCSAPCPHQNAVPSSCFRLLAGTQPAHRHLLPFPHCPPFSNLLISLQPSSLWQASSFSPLVFFFLSGPAQYPPSLPGSVVLCRSVSLQLQSGGLSVCDVRTQQKKRRNKLAVVCRFGWSFTGQRGDMMRHTNKLKS